MLDITYKLQDLTFYRVASGFSANGHRLCEPPLIPKVWQEPAISKTLHNVVKPRWTKKKSLWSKSFCCSFRRRIKGIFHHFLRSLKKTASDKNPTEDSQEFLSKIFLSPYFVLIPKSVAHFNPENYQVL